MVVSSTLVMREQLQRLSRDAGHSSVGLQILLVDRPLMAYGELSAFLFSEPSSGPGRPKGLILKVIESRSSGDQREP